MKHHGAQTIAFLGKIVGWSRGHTTVASLIFEMIWPGMDSNENPPVTGASL